MSNVRRQRDQQRLAEWNSGEPIRIAYQRSLLEAEDYVEDWDDPADDEEDWFDCGWVRGVGCTMAGSEECDWECPYRKAFERGLALTRARMAKRAKAKKEEQ